MAEAKKYQERSEVPQQWRWRLEDIFASDPAWEQAFLEVTAQIDQLKKYKGRLETCQTLLEALSLSSQLDQEMMELYSYARMRRDQDNKNSLYQDMADRAMGLYYKIQSEQAFFVPEIAALEPELLQGWLDHEQKLAPYRHDLEDIIRQKPHILSEREETILSLFGPVASGIGDTYTMLDNVDINLGSVQNGQGETIKLTHGTFGQLRDHPDRELRAAAFRQVHESFAAVGNTLATLYSTQIKADIMLAQSRHHQTSLDAALFANNLPVSLYSSLIEAIHDGQSVLDRYFQLRCRWLELNDLHIYDTYIPMIKMPQRRYTYEQACDLLRLGLAPLGREYLDAVERHLQERWIDVCETPGKTSGAYSWGTYRSHPYVLLNYSGTLSDVFTLAHEVGHSLHTLWSNQRPYSESHYPIFLAEIASTVNENLLLQAMLSQCDLSTEAGRQEKAYLLNHFLETFRLTVFRQTMFAEFEWQAHQKAETGQALTAESLCSLYASLLGQYFGPTVIVDDYMHWEWSRIPHFYSSYYVYQYATGFSAAVALSRRILEQGAPAVCDYLKFLGAGGADYPLNILAEAGVDLSGPEPIKAAVKAFSETLDQLDELTPAGGV